MIKNAMLNGRPAEDRTLEDFLFLDESLRAATLELYEGLFSPWTPDKHEERFCATIGLYKAMKLSPETVGHICDIPAELTAEIYEAPRRFAEFLKDFPVQEPKGPFAPAQITRLCMFFDQKYLVLNSPDEELRMGIDRGVTTSAMSYYTLEEFTDVQLGYINAFAHGRNIPLSYADKFALMAHLNPPQTARVSPDGRLRSELNALIHTHRVSPETLSLLRRAPVDSIEDFAAGGETLSDAEKFSLAAVVFRLGVILEAIRAVPENAAA
ncbi:MAG: hypothetical protein LBC28_01945 [Oscillospiraceae bacterium]|jgi:hypothetical protein|nr:hypothetical protein [Oscillospiraceae bacterium]